MTNGVFWDIKTKFVPQRRQIPRSVRRLLVTANVSSSMILVTRMMEALISSETSVLQEKHGVTSQKTPFSYPLGSSYIFKVTYIELRIEYIADLNTLFFLDCEGSGHAVVQR
jgi:hypothetical protein